MGRGRVNVVDGHHRAAAAHDWPGPGHNRPASNVAAPSRFRHASQQQLSLLRYTPRYCDSSPASQSLKPVAAMHSCAVPGP